MDLKSKVLYGVVLGGVLALTAGGVYRYAIAKDFMIEQDVWCDAEAGEQCFYEVCLNDWWWPCTGDPEADIWVYKRVTKPYHAIEEGLFAEPCVPGETIGEDEYCPEIACEEGEPDCSVLYCDMSIDDDCYIGDNIDLAEEEWYERLAEVGLEPIIYDDEEVIDEGTLIEESDTLDEGEGDPEDSTNILSE